MALVEMGSSESFEMNGSIIGNNAPPLWIDALEETQYILSRLRVKIEALLDLHSKQLTRPTLDDMPQVYQNSIKLNFTTIRNSR